MGGKGKGTERKFLFRKNNESLMLYGTGIDAEQGIDRAESDEAGDQRKNSDPSPHHFRTDKDHRYQGETQKDTDHSIDPSDV
jgi:hypothetical protein